MTFALRFGNFGRSIIQQIMKKKEKDSKIERGRDFEVAYGT
jgi:hypothetical protein